MKKGLVRLISGAAVAAMLFTALPSCGKTDKKDNPQNEPDTQQSTTGANSPMVSKDLVKIRFLSYARADFQYTTEMPVIKELQKRTNVQLELELLPVSDAASKLNLVIASGDLPDMISYSSLPLINKYGSEGAFIALDDLIEKNAPNIKKAFNSPPFPIPYIKGELKASDGKIYNIPFITETVTGAVFCIREDWLDTLGLKAPETTDDLYAVLKAFKSRDPNGNGKNDEIAFSYPGVNNAMIFLNSFGAHLEFYVASDGTIKYGPIENNYREGLEFVRKLVAEELVDPEFMSMNTAQWNAKVANNAVGMFYGWPFSGLAASNTAVQKLNPKFKYVSILPVKGPRGDRFKEYPQSSVIARTVITRANKHPKETIKFLDYLFTDEGIRLCNWGLEGKDYKLVNGKPQFTDFILHNPDGKDIATIRAMEGMQMMFPTIATLEPEIAAAVDPEVGKAWKKYADAKAVWTLFPSLPLTDDQKIQASNKVTEIQTYVAENNAKFLLGQRSLDTYPEFVEQINKMGIKDVLKTYNDAYNKYKEFCK